MNKLYTKYSFDQLDHENTCEHMKVGEKGDYQSLRVTLVFGPVQKSTWVCTRIIVANVTFSFGVVCLFVFFALFVLELPELHGSSCSDL